MRLGHLADRVDVGRRRRQVEDDHDGGDLSTATSVATTRPSACRNSGVAGAGCHGVRDTLGVKM